MGNCAKSFQNPSKPNKPYSADKLGQIQNSPVKHSHETLFTNQDQEAELNILHTPYKPSTTPDLQLKVPKQSKNSQASKQAVSLQSVKKGFTSRYLKKRSYLAPGSLDDPNQSSTDPKAIVSGHPTTTRLPIVIRHGDDAQTIRHKRTSFMGEWNNDFRQQVPIPKIKFKTMQRLTMEPPSATELVKSTTRPTSAKPKIDSIIYEVNSEVFLRQDYISSTKQSILIYTHALTALFQTHQKYLRATYPRMVTLLQHLAVPHRRQVLSTLFELCQNPHVSYSKSQLFEKLTSDIEEYTIGILTFIKQGLDQKMIRRMRPGVNLQQLDMLIQLMIKQSLQTANISSEVKVDQANSGSSIQNKDYWQRVIDNLQDVLAFAISDLLV